MNFHEAGIAHRQGVICRIDVGDGFVRGAVVEPGDGMRRHEAVEVSVWKESAPSADRSILSDPDLKSETTSNRAALESAANKKNETVVSIAACELVGAIAAYDGIAAIIAVDRIAPRASIDLVISVISLDRVIAGPGVDKVAFRRRR